MRQLLFCLALVALTILPAPVQATEPTARPEMLSDQAHADWQAIGRINVAGFDTGGMCTGTLIAPDLVLTAAHCLYAVRGIARAAPGQVHFLAGWLKGDYAAHRTAAEIHVHPGYNHGKPITFKSMRTDLAVLRLAEPILDVAPLPIAPRAKTGGALSLIGYRRDRANALSRHADCRVLTRQEGLLGLDCAVIFGTSGAPVLTRTPFGWRVVGVVSAGSTGDGPVKTVAAPIPEGFIAPLLQENGD